MGHEIIRFDKNSREQDPWMIYINLVELKKVPLASSLNTATTWAAKRGLRAGEVDLNHDGHPETVVYNKAGQPVIINGYKLKPSDYPIRKEYYSRFPNREDRIDNSMSSWVKSAAYDVQVDPNNPWKRTVNNTQFGEQLKDWGYRMPTKPKKSFSVFSVFSKLIAPIVKAYLESNACANIFSETGGSDCVMIFRKLVSPITLYRVLYMKIVERSYYFELLNQRLISNYKSFKQYIKDHPSKFWSFFVANFLNDDLLTFKPGVITPESVALNLVKGTCQWDGSDKDDVVVFLIGLKNIQDEEINDILTNDSKAKEFNDLLKGAKSRERTAAAKALEKWKQRARESQKDFFKNMIQYLFENEDAFGRYSEARSRGLNPFTNASSPEEAEAAAPVDVRTVEDGTAEHIQAPGSASPVRGNDANVQALMSELSSIEDRIAEGNLSSEESRRLQSRLSDIQAELDTLGVPYE